MELEEVRLLLTSQEVKVVTRALVDLRTRVLATKKGVAELLEHNFMASLLQLLDRTNTKVLDLALSIVANLLLEGLARSQLRAGGGLARLISILTNLGEPSVLCRAWRAVANSLQAPHSCLAPLQALGLPALLAKALAGHQAEPLLQVLVRCVRLAATTPTQRYILLRDGVTAALGEVAVAARADTGNLAKALAKCLAHLTLGAGVAVGEVLVVAAPSLVHWAGQGGRLAEHSLAAIVNMSEVCGLRPRLGNEGVVECLVAAHPAAAGRMAACVTTALCLYCRESVNRVKLRESGGCRLLVQVLLSRETSLAILHDRVVNSLLQFIYDNHSLNVLMDCGLVRALVGLLEDHMARVVEGRQGGACLCPGELEKLEEEVKEENSDNKAEETDGEVVTEEQEAVSSEEVVEATAEAAGGEERSQRAGPVFRLTSPSYQAVHLEVEHFQQLKEARGWGGAPSSSPGRWGGAPAPSSPAASPGWAPNSPLSIPISPDRSPPSLSCHYSPSYSPSSSSSRSPSSSLRYSPTLSYSPSSSPPYSPQEPTYSPVENFSDDEPEESPAPGPSATALQPPSAPPPLEGPSHPDVLSTSEPPSSPPSTCTTCGSACGARSHKRCLPTPSSPPSGKRPATYLGQPFPLPSSPPIAPSDTPPPPQFQYSASSPPHRPAPSPRPPARPPPSKGSRLTWLLQLLSRLTQAERPHADLSTPRALAALFSFICLVAGGVERAGKVLLRLSTNLHCLMAWVLHRHLPFLLLATERLATRLAGCEECRPHLLQVCSFLGILCTPALPLDPCTALHSCTALHPCPGAGPGEGARPQPEPARRDGLRRGRGEATCPIH